MKNMKIGVQMYTLREELEHDYKGVCRELKRIGVEGVEIAFTYGNMNPEELAAYFRELGIEVFGVHMMANDILSGMENPRALDYALATGAKYLTVSKGGDFTQVWEECRDTCAAGGLLAQKYNKIFTYHNHAAEFVDIGGIRAIDRIFVGTDPQTVMSELDVYWVQKGGADPVDYIRKYAARLPELHLKDLSAETGSFTELGRGVIDLAGCVNAAANSICEWLIYEQDKCDGGNALDSTAVSIEYLRKIAK